MKNVQTFFALYASNILVLFQLSSVALAAQSAAGVVASAAWQTEWDKTMVAAKREGRVVVAGGPGETYRRALTAFQAAYPDIKLELTGASGRDWGPKVLSERQAGLYLWDVHVGGPDTPNAMLKPKGVFDPLRPALIFPEILDDSKWLGGFDDGWMDKDRQFIYAFQGNLNALVLVNREFVSEAELNNLEQLLDPKWKGKISWNEPRTTGAGSAVAAYWLVVKGEAWVRQLLGNEVTITRDLRQQAEWLVRGRYPVGIAVDETRLRDFQAQGLGLKVERLEPRSPLVTRIGPAFGNVMLINRASHLNAAKVYINWLLSKAGQTRWVEAVEVNSRRLDVAGPPETAPDPKVKYVNVNKEEYLPYMHKARDLATAILGK